MMIKIKDRITLGVVSGFIAGLTARLANELDYRKGYTDVKYGETVSRLFLPRRKRNTPDERLIGTLTTHLNQSISGLLITYMLSATGRDKAVLKGTGYSVFSWFIMYGLNSRLDTSITPKKRNAHVLNFKDNLIFGTICTLLITELGHDSLFPDTKLTRRSEKLPLIALNRRKPVLEQTDSPKSVRS